MRLRLVWLLLFSVLFAACGDERADDGAMVEKPSGPALVMFYTDG